MGETYAAAISRASVQRHGLCSGNYRFGSGIRTGAPGRLAFYGAHVKDLRGSRALVTGAAGGLGRYISRALAEEGVSLAVSGRQAGTLEELCAELRRSGVQAEPVVADLVNPEQVAGLVESAEAAIGPLDLLINNAGLEIAAPYPAFTDDELADITRVNLIAPMVLTRHALPGMLQRGRGHIVTISSLAGRGGIAYNALYATTKAGLIGFARSIRAELAATPVSSSVICPGFISHDGMYARMEEVGLKAPLLLHAVGPERVGSAVVKAITEDRPEILVSALPLRPLFAVQELAPRVAERIVAATGAAEFFEHLSERRGRGANHLPT
jgi:short-subunit dehydrogenase